MKYIIKNRFDDIFLLAVHIDCDENVPESLKKGLALKWVLKNNLPLSIIHKADFRGADITVLDTDEYGLIMPEWTGGKNEI